MLTALCMFWLSEINIIVSISQRRKLSFREGKWFALGHTAGAWLSQAESKAWILTMPSYHGSSVHAFLCLEEKFHLEDSYLNFRFIYQFMYPPSGLFTKYLWSTYWGPDSALGRRVQLWIKQVFIEHSSAQREMTIGSNRTSHHQLQLSWVLDGQHILQAQNKGPLPSLCGQGRLPGGSDLGAEMGRMRRGYQVKRWGENVLGRGPGMGETPTAWCVHEACRLSSQLPTQGVTYVNPVSALI